MNNEAEIIVSKPGNRIEDIPIREIQIYSKQPRKFFNPISLRELAKSIDEEGQVNAGKVRLLEQPTDGYKYELVDGERRLRACLLAGKTTVRAEIDETVTDEAKQFTKSVVSNFARDDMSTTEVIRSIIRLKDELGFSLEQIAAKIGKSIGYVNNHYNMRKLDAEVIKLMEPDIPDESRIVAGVALLLVPIIPKYQIALAKEISSKSLSMKQAKHLIQVAIHGKGGIIPRRPDKEFEALEGFIERTKEQLEIILNKSPEVLHEIIKAGQLQRRMHTLELVDELIATFPELAKKIKKLTETTGDERLRQRLSTIRALEGLAESFPELKRKLDEARRRR